MLTKKAKPTHDAKDPRPFWQKKLAAPWGAAKFREETPRKGGGVAMGDRDTALQQYGEMGFCTQAPEHTLANFSPRKTSEKFDMTLNQRPIWPFCDILCSAK